MDTYARQMGALSILLPTRKGPVSCTLRPRYKRNNSQGAAGRDRCEKGMLLDRYDQRPHRTSDVADQA